MESSTALAPTGVAPALMRAPIIDQLDPEQVKLLTARAQAGSKGTITRGEIAAFLELAATYGLDPFASEVWLAKGKNDKVLIMVGRDGLRKIAQRNGLVVDGDVIHEGDAFKVDRQPDGSRAVTHAYGHPKDRGPIVGAWCEVRMMDRVTFGGSPSPLRTESGRAAGFFVATVDEYKPTSDAALQYSPWGSQESVMILAAAERQALRQATPLSGLVAQGELDRAEEADAVVPLDESGPLHEDPELAEAAELVLKRADAAGHAGYANRGAAAMALRGQPRDVAVAWLNQAEEELQRWENMRSDSAVAQADPYAAQDGPACEALDPHTGERCELAAGHDGHHYAAGVGWDEFLPPEEGPKPAPELGPDTLRKMAKDHRSVIATDISAADQARLHAEADELEARADALEADPEQTELGVEG